ncbi:MAG: hypothetical protein OES69_18035 [Myxococcales bacterium]|nr:hypothetical protein [Myxococcales bacterium]MDH3845844.1 hypothetical protein [Myxococcales bacterium]
MRMRSIATIVLVAGLANGCTKGVSLSPAENPAEVEKILAYAEEGMGGCDHDIELNAVAEHAWPFPAEARNVRWGNHYQKMKLKLKPRPAAFVTATVTWKEGELIEVEDSELIVQKPRRVLAKHDMFVTRKIWDQGVLVEHTTKAVSAGGVTSFLFYNSRGYCMILADDGPAWTKCTLDGSFEGVTAEQPFACQQTWWIKVRKNKIDKGWMPFEDALMVRVPPKDGAAK